jgi:hypothetical protein
MKKYAVSLLIAFLAAGMIMQASTTYTMGYPPPGGVTFSSNDSTGQASGEAGGETFFYSGFNSADYSTLYWGLNTVANVAEGSISTSNMAYQGYNSSTGLAIWLSTANWTFTSGLTGNPVSTGTALLMQVQPYTGTAGGFLTTGFINPTTTKGALGITTGNPSEPLWQITGNYQMTFQYLTFDGNPEDSVPIFVYNQNNQGGPGVETSTDFEFWWSSVVVTPPPSKTNAKTVQVGGCKTTLVNFPTIQSAISAVPANATIEVCPGTYPEQLTITQGVKIEGIVSGAGDAAVVTVPVAGLAPNGTSSSAGPIAAQVDVQNAVGIVTISNMVVDGTGGMCSTSGDPSFGIAYEGSNGTIMDTVVRSVTNSSCNSFTGAAVDIEGGTVKVTNNSIHGFSDQGVNVNAGVATISSNTITGGTNGIFLEQCASMSVSSNTISGASNAGIDADSGTGLKITSNKISGGNFGVMLTPNEGPSTGNVVQSNNVSGASTGLSINDGGSAGSNTITNNTITDGSCGISESAALGDALTPNTVFTVVATTCP